MYRLATTICSAIVFTTPGLFSRSAQSPAALQIASPASKTVVNPGQVFTITVTSPAGLIFINVTVIGESPFGFGDLEKALPAQFTFKVPTDASAGDYDFTAVGNPSPSGPQIYSAQVSLDVERSDLPVTIAPMEATIFLENAGETAPITLLAQFSDRSVMDVTHSSYVTYSSLNTEVATVDANGIVTEVAPGTGAIRATYVNGPDTRSISIPVKVLFTARKQAN